MKRVTPLLALAIIAVVAFWVWPGFLTHPANPEGGPAAYRTGTVTRRKVL